MKDGSIKTILHYSITPIFLFMLTACCSLLIITDSYAQVELTNAVKKAVLNELKKSVSGDVEVNGLRVISGADVFKSPDGYTVVNAAMNGYAGRNKAHFSVGLKNRKMETKSIIVEASYDVLVDMFITSRPLVKGTTLSVDDFYIVKQKSSRLPAGAVLSMNDLEGKALKTNIGQGVILRSDHLTTQLSIKRGQRVNVVVEGGNVVITTQGALINDTALGGTAKVLCDVSKKEVNGVLTSPNTVRVKI
jgi:flagella basal body P-ring formation protein FlgA